MYHVLHSIIFQHDLRLVGLAVVLSLFASATAMTMIARGRTAQGRQREFWLIVGGVVAGCGIWGLHFVAMLAYRAGVPVSYDVSETIASALIAALLCGLGFRVALSRFGAIAGGCVVGVAVCAMHYVGMAAMRMPARMVMDEGYVLASVVIGVSLSAVSLWVALRRADLRSYALGAGFLAIATAGMHFTAMSAMRLTPVAHMRLSGAVLDPNMLAIAVASSVVLVMVLGLGGALVDYHLARRAQSEAERLRAHVTELERTQEELHQRSDELQEALSAAAAASDAKSQFLAAMSHELRTPLNAILGFSEILSTELFGPLGDARYREYVQNIGTSGAHLLKLINDILDLSRLDIGRIALKDEEFRLDELIAGEMRLLEGQARDSGIELVARIEDGKTVLRIDALRIRQVMTHVLGNAIKFTAAGGRIEIRVWRAADGVTIAVSDTGIGIAADDIPKAFEPFRQLDGRLSRQFEGAGLGLPLARRLVEMHGGRLMLVSAPNVGTTATIHLPAERIVDGAAAATRAVA